MYIVFVILSVLALFALEFLLCRKSRSPLIRALPMGYAAAALALAVAALYSEPSGFLDLRSFAATILAVYAVVCAAAIGLGWLLGRRK